MYHLNSENHSKCVRNLLLAFRKELRPLSMNDLSNIKSNVSEQIYQVVSYSQTAYCYLVLLFPKSQLENIPRVR